MQNLINKFDPNELNDNLSQPIYEAILQSIGDGLVVVERSGNIIYVNQTFEKLLGWKAKEVMGKPLLKVIPREDEVGNDVPFKERILSVVLSGKTTSTTSTPTPTTTYYFIRKDKSRFPVALLVTPVFLKGEIIGAIESFRDITKEKKAQKLQTRQLLHEVELEEKVKIRTKELVKEKAKEDAILAGIQDGMVVMDQAGRVVTMNLLAEVMLGLKMFPGEKFFDLVKIKDEAFINLVLTAKKRITDNSHYLTRQDGTRFPASITVAPILVGDNSISSVLIFQDITEIKKLEQIKNKQLRQEIELEQKERNFISLASHQLLTPLTLIEGYISMLASGRFGSTDKDAKGYLNEALEGAKRMGKMIKSLLTTSKIENRSLKVQKSVFDLAAVISKVCSDLKPKSEQKGLKVEFVNSLHIKVLADQDLTREVLSNLLDNAIKYTEKGEVTITVKNLTSDAQVTIKDTGVGIRENDLKKIFDKFYMSENWLSKQSESTGLGLYIAKLLIGLMGGNIQVESQVGKGSIFTFTLPLAKNEQKKAIAD